MRIVGRNVQSSNFSMVTYWAMRSCGLAGILLNSLVPAATCILMRSCSSMAASHFATAQQSTCKTSLLSLLLVDAGPHAFQHRSHGRHRPRSLSQHQQIHRPSLVCRDVSLEP